MSRELKKLAMIRKNEADPCPFGLDIPLGCANVGDLITKMGPLSLLGMDADDEEKSELIKANRKLFNWQAPGSPCLYAGNILAEKTKAVECNWGETDEGDKEAALVGSPNYFKNFSGNGLDGTFTFPLGYYSDNSIDRGIYYGGFSIESIAEELLNSHNGKSLIKGK